MKNKKILIIIIVLLVILALCGGTFAYVYFATDLLKSNSQMFAKYGEEVEKSVTEFFNDETAKSYFANKSANNHENTGAVKLKISRDNENNEYNADLNLTFKGATDVDNESFEQGITINYSDTEKFLFKCVKNNNMVALGSDEVANKYVGIANNKLSELANKLGVGEDIEVPDNIDIDNSRITIQKIKELEEKYLKIITNQLSESNFTKNNDTSYTLTIENDNLKNIMVNCLNEAKNDTEIIELFGMNDNESTYQNNVEQVVEELNEQDFSNTFIKITLTSSENKMEAGVELQTGENNSKFAIIIENGKNIKIKQTNNSYTANIVTGEINTTPNDTVYTIAKENSNNTHKYSITSSSESYSLEIGFELGNISENGATERAYITYNADDANFDVDYNNVVTFKDKVTVTELNDDNSVALNNYSQEDLSSLLQQLLAQIVKVNSQKIQNAYGF